jgi:hypothetical protein
MKRFFALILSVTMSLVCSTTACNTTPAFEQGGCGANFTPLIQPGENLGICILQASISDLVDAISDPLSLVPAIISSCLSYGEATVAQVIQIIEQALTANPVAEAGPGDAVRIQRLKKVHAAALSRLHLEAGVQ